MESLLIKRLSNTATLPTRGTSGSIGYDLYADLPDANGVLIAPGERALVPTSIAMAIPTGTYGRVAPRSGLAVKNGIDVLAGVIDSDYRGEVKVLLVNHDRFAYHVKHGDRIAQLIVEVAATPNVLEVDALDDTIRGDGGYGSTGR